MYQANSTRKLQLFQNAWLWSEQFSLGIFSYYSKFMIMQHKLGKQKFMYIKAIVILPLSRIYEREPHGVIWSQLQGFQFAYSICWTGWASVYPLPNCCMYLTTGSTKTWGGGRIELSAMLNKSWAGAQAPSHKWERKRSYATVLWQIHKIIICIETTSLLSKLDHIPFNVTCYLILDIATVI